MHFCYSTCNTKKQRQVKGAEHIVLDMYKILLRLWNLCKNEKKTKECLTTTHSKALCKTGSSEGNELERTFQGQSLYFLGRSVCGKENTSGGTWQGTASSSTPAPLRQPHWDCCWRGPERRIRAKVWSQTDRWRQTVWCAFVLKRKQRTHLYVGMGGGGWIIRCAANLFWKI